MAEPSARKKIAALLVQKERIELQIEELQPLADAEPVEFDGTKVPVGANVIIQTKEGPKAARVLAKKEAVAGVKGPGLMFKVVTGSDFDMETRVVYPGQIISYNDALPA